MKERFFLFLFLGPPCCGGLDVEAPVSLIQGPRILALRAAPPELRPGGQLSLRALVATPGGEAMDAPVEWAWCTAPKPLTEDNVVAAGCLGEGAIVPLGAGIEVRGAVPEDACVRFGPDVPPPQEGEAPRRPRDPDATGGYYQPVRARLPGQVAFGLVRLDCGLAGAPASVVMQYRARHAPNLPPRLLGVEIGRGQEGTGTGLHLRAAWSAGSAERYPVYDALAVALVERREGLRASWFATAGAFTAPRTGRGGDEEETWTDTGWSAPAAPDPVHLFVVLRDERGGVDWIARTF